MAAMRISDMAKELGISSKAIIRKCVEEGVPPDKVKSHASVLSSGLQASIREWFSNPSPSFVPPVIPKAEPKAVPKQDQNVQPTIDLGLTERLSGVPGFPTPSWTILAFRLFQRAVAILNPVDMELEPILTGPVAEFHRRLTNGEPFNQKIMNRGLVVQWPVSLAALATKLDEIALALQKIRNVAVHTTNDWSMSHFYAHSKEVEEALGAIKKFEIVLAQVIAPENVVPLVSEFFEDAFLIADFAKRGRYASYQAFDPDLLGSLWKLGRPKEFAEENVGPGTEKGAVIELSIPAEIESDIADLRIAELLGVLSQLHRDFGGSGLTIKDGLAYDPALELAPAGGCQ